MLQISDKINLNNLVNSESWKQLKSCVKWNGVEQEKSNQRLKVEEHSVYEIWYIWKNCIKTRWCHTLEMFRKWKEYHINWNGVDNICTSLLVKLPVENNIPFSEINLDQETPIEGIG